MNAKVNRRLVVGIGITLVGTIASARMLLTQRNPMPARPHRGPPERVADWKSYSTSGHIVGPAHPAVTITTFCDFRCPFCRKASGIIDSIQRAHTAEVAVAFHHFPLARHPAAFTASLAAECAGAQGRFAELARLLYRTQGSWVRIGWGRLAERADVSDTIAFTRCLRDTTYAAIVRADMDGGNRLGVSGTPTILINGFRLHEPPTREVLENLVSAELARHPEQK